MRRLYLSATTATVLVTLAWTASAAADVAAEAYQLRLKGKVAEARTMLEEALAETPGNAAAHYELARTKMHMALGHPQNMEQSFADARKSIERAVAHDAQQVIYHAFAGHIAVMQAYYALQMDKPNLSQHFTAASKAFETALKLKPDYHQVALYLVELHSQFPGRAGANTSEAKTFARQLESAHDVYAAKAKSILAPDSCDAEFWKELLAKQPGNSEVLEELGKVHLKQDQVELAEKYFEQAIQRDPNKIYLFLDLSIYHTFRAMRARQNDKTLFQECLTAGDAAITRYLKSKPIQPMEAYALGVRSKYKSAAGDREQGQQLVKRAEALDPYFSKATGAPHPDEFIHPNEISTRHRYLMRPF